MNSLEELLALVEKEGNHYEWQYKGYNCEITRCIHKSTHDPNKKMAGHWCGYVILPKGHPYRLKDYQNMNVSVHGGLSYQDKEGRIGFDCGHLGDVEPFDLANNEIQDPEIILNTNNYWTKEEVIREVERMVDQLNTNIQI